MDPNGIDYEAYKKKHGISDEAFIESKAGADLPCYTEADFRAEREQMLKDRIYGTEHKDWPQPKPPPYPPADDEDKLAP